MCRHVDWITLVGNLRTHGDVVLRLILLLLIPVACFGEVPKSIVGKWQFHSVRTMTEYMDQVFEANPEVATAEQIQASKLGLSLSLSFT